MNSPPLPKEFTFDNINDYVHDVDRHFEELQWLCLALAAEIDRLRSEAEKESE